ncbi:MAG: hypothetical protein M3O71_21620 [Bacteroidota bacterium]|nr:hypothetical protein [Bacteroidota bacterium]
MEFKAATRYKNGSSTTVHYNNYRFTLSDNCLTAKGSLTKLYFGNNIQNLNFNQLQLALMEFESLFQIPFDEAKILRIDIAANVIMEKPINLYLDLFTKPSGYKLRLYEAETKSFEGSKNSLCFYDKIAELKHKDRAVYSSFETENVLKYEIKLSKNIARNLSLNDLRLKSLYDPEVYRILINCWLDGYYKVPKLTKMLPSQLNFQTLGALKDSLIHEGLNSFGGKESLMIATHRAKMPKHVRHSIKKFLDGIVKVEPYDLFLQLEIDNKINMIYNNELSLLD